jgi:hypothetical protein
MPRDIKELKSKKIEALEQDAIKILSEKFKKPPETHSGFKVIEFTKDRPSGSIQKPIALKPNPKLLTKNIDKNH